MGRKEEASREVRISRGKGKIEACIVESLNGKCDLLYVGAKVCHLFARHVGSRVEYGL